MNARTFLARMLRKTEFFVIHGFFSNSNMYIEHIMVLCLTSFQQLSSKNISRFIVRLKNEKPVIFSLL